MEYAKNKISTVNIISTIACIAILSMYSFKNSSEIGVFGNIAIVVSAYGVLSNSSSLIHSLGENIGVSKSLLKSIDIVIFTVVGFLVGTILV